MSGKLKFAIGAMVAVALFCVASFSEAAGEWLRTGPVWLKGLNYAGTSKVQLTNAAGNLSTTSGTFSGAVTSDSLAATADVTIGDDLVLSDTSAGVTASTTSAQGVVAASGLISNTVTQVTTAASAGDSKTLPSVALGSFAVVCNHAASNAIDVFPFTSDQINNVSADAAVSLAAGECMQCYGMSTSRWGCVIGSAT